MSAAELPLCAWVHYDLLTNRAGLLAPLRPAIYHLLAHRADYGKITILYGARTPQDLLYTREYDEWRKKEISRQGFASAQSQLEATGNLFASNRLFHRRRLCI